MELPATALELPASVSVHATPPAVVTLGALQAAVKPLGRPEAMLMLDPAAPLAADAPPSGVAVTVTFAEESDSTEIETGDTASAMDWGCVTETAIFSVAVSPSPVAVTVTAVDCAFAVEAAVSVSVSALEPEVAAWGFFDQAPVTPVGRPLMLQLMFPLNEPPAFAVRLTAVEEPMATEAVLDAAVTASEGGKVTVSA